MVVGAGGNANRPRANQQQKSNHRKTHQSQNLVGQKNKPCRKKLTLPKNDENTADRKRPRRRGTKKNCIRNPRHVRPPPPSESNDQVHVTKSTPTSSPPFHAPLSHTFYIGPCHTLCHRLQNRVNRVEIALARPQTPPPLFICKTYCTASPPTDVATNHERGTEFNNLRHCCCVAVLNTGARFLSSLFCGESAADALSRRKRSRKRAKYDTAASQQMRRRAVGTRSLAHHHNQFSRITQPVPCRKKNHRHMTKITALLSSSSFI